MYDDQDYERMRNAYTSLLAWSICQSMQIRTLTKAVAKVCAMRDGIKAGEDMIEWIWKEEQIALNNKLAEISDDDPVVATKLKTYLRDRIPRPDA